MTEQVRTIGVLADTKGQARCRGANCGAAITWAEVAASGKRMCFTGDPVALRTEHTADGRLVEHLPFDDNHWAACPDRARFGRKGQA